MKISTRAKKKKNVKRIWPGRNKTASFWWHKKSFCPLTVNISIGQGNGKKRKRDMLREEERTSKKKGGKKMRKAENEKNHVMSLSAS